jgi:hypothetical protein
VSRSGLMKVVEKVRFGNLHPPIVRGLPKDVRLILFDELVFFVCSVLGLLSRFNTPRWLVLLWLPLYLVDLGASLICDWVDVLRLESFLGAHVDLFL